MKLFICWSGRRGEALANLLKLHLEAILPDELSAFVSTELEKGLRWSERLRTELRGADAGLVCLTPDGVRSPWIHYEAGALEFGLSGRSGARSRRIFTYLLGVQAADLSGPLAGFQATAATYHDTRRLVESLAASLPEGTFSDAELQAAFDERWPRLEEELAHIDRLPLSDVFPDLERYFERKTFQEPIDRCTAQTWVARHSGARDTFSRLEAERATIAAECRPYVLDLFTQLLSELDAYAMDMRSLLIDERSFPLSEDGRVALDSGIEATCEERRKRCRQLVNALCDEKRAPAFEEACRFEALESFQEKKSIIHAKEGEIERAPDRFAESDRLGRAADSEWVFDRIVFYLVRALQDGLEVSDCLNWVRKEFEKIRASSGRPTLMGLSYSLAPLAVAVERQGEDADAGERVLPLLRRVHDHLLREGLDQGRQVRESLRDIAEAMGEMRVFEDLDAIPGDDGPG